MHCPLCQQDGTPFYLNVFFLCPCCLGIFKNKSDYVDPDAEIRRYKEHNNDVNDIRYQKFVSPITHHVLHNFSPIHRGLDFGSGTDPVVSKLLQDNGYDICQFDPFFSNKPDLLTTETYDYIVSCEVIEHFHDPDAEFKRLYQLLKPNGELICMTHLYDNDIDFKAWYYKNDPTHVFFYQPKTINFIADLYGFSDVKINGRLVLFKS